MLTLVGECPCRLGWESVHADLGGGVSLLTWVGECPCCVYSVVLVS